MIHHLILTGEEADFRLQSGILQSGDKKVALQVLGSVQCLAVHARWSQSALTALAQQCPVIMARWNNRAEKWETPLSCPAVAM